MHRGPHDSEDAGQRARKGNSPLHDRQRGDAFGEPFKDAPNVFTGGDPEYKR